MANLDDLIIRIKTILDSGGLDSAADKVKRVESQVENSSKTFNRLGASGASSFMQIQYGADNALSNVNRNMQSISSNSSGLWNNIKSGASSTWGTIKSGAGSAWESIKSGANSMGSSISSAFEKAKSGASDFMANMEGMQGMMMGVLGGIGVTSIYDKIFGTGMKVETNKIIVDTMASSKSGSASLYNAIDEATNKYLMSMQDVIPAINAFKASTGANDAQLKIAANTMSSFGSQVLLLTDSEQLANTAMYDLSKGLEGNFLTLRRYGVTKESLLATGKWTGEANDIKGYLNAVEEVAGMDPRMMTTTQGIITSIGKQFSIAGKKIAEDLLPILKTIVTAFYDLNKALGGNLAKGILLVVGALSSLMVIGGAASMLWPLLTGGIGALIPLLGLLIPGFTGSTIAMSLSAAAAGNASIQFNLLGASIKASLLSALPIIAAFAAAIGIAAVAIYVLTSKQRQGIETMSRYNDFLKNGEQKIQDIKAASESYTKKAHEMEAVRDRIAANGGNVANMEKQIQQAYKDSAYYAEVAKNAEEALEKGREQRKQFEADKTISQHSYNQGTTDLMYTGGFISEGQKSQLEDYNAIVLAGGKQEQVALERSQRIRAIGYNQIKDIASGHSKLNGYYKDNVKELENLGKAYDELAIAKEKSETADNWGAALEGYFEQGMSKMKIDFINFKAEWNTFWKNPLKILGNIDLGKMLSKMFVPGNLLNLGGVGGLLGTLDIAGLIKMPEIKVPEWPSLETLIPPLQWPTVELIVSSLSGWFGIKILTFVFPTALQVIQTVSSWLGIKIPFFRIPTAGQVLSKISSWLGIKIPTLEWPSLSKISGWIQSAVSSAVNSIMPGGAGYEGYINEDYGKGSYYEGNSTSSSSVSSSSVVTNSSSSSKSSVVNHNTVKVEVKGDIDSSSRANELAEKVIKEAAIKLNKLNNANAN